MLPDFQRAQQDVGRVNPGLGAQGLFDGGRIEPAELFKTLRFAGDDEPGLFAGPRRARVTPEPAQALQQHVGGGQFAHDQIGAGYTLNMVIAIMTAIVVIYTVLGGLWAVLTTDVLQFFVVTLVTLLSLPLALSPPTSSLQENLR